MHTGGSYAKLKKKLSKSLHFEVKMLVEYTDVESREYIHDQS